MAGGLEAERAEDHPDTFKGTLDRERIDGKRDREEIMKNREKERECVDNETQVRFSLIPGCMFTVPFAVQIVEPNWCPGIFISTGAVTYTRHEAPLVFGVGTRPSPLQTSLRLNPHAK